MTSQTEHFLKTIQLRSNELGYIIPKSTYQALKNHTKDYLTNNPNTNILKKGTLDEYEYYNEILIRMIESPEAYVSIAYNAAIHFSDFKNRLMACHFINLAGSLIQKCQNSTSDAYIKLAKVLIPLNYSDLAVSLIIKSGLETPLLSNNEKNILNNSFKSMINAAEKSKQHGHMLLMQHLSKLDRISLVGKTVIEIGTTRENIPGQGSTRQLAELCNEFGMKFITVDMDPNNSANAKNLFKKMNFPFEAITDKGEVFLENYNGQIDFIFLDAYDYDHGKHDELRQARYLKYLGEKIDEEQCHQMHLTCAMILSNKINNCGAICIDDTWQDSSSNWTAKGTLAVPFLIKNGFEVLEKRNNAVLLSRL